MRRPPVEDVKPMFVSRNRPPSAATPTTCPPASKAPSAAPTVPGSAAEVLVHRPPVEDSRRMSASPRQSAIPRASKVPSAAPMGPGRAARAPAPHKSPVPQPRSSPVDAPERRRLSSRGAAGGSSRLDVTTSSTEAFDRRERSPAWIRVETKTTTPTFLTDGRTRGPARGVARSGGASQR